MDCYGSVVVEQPTHDPKFVGLYPAAIAIRGLYYKTLRIPNLLEIDIFRCKSFLLLVTFTCLDKHTSLLQNLYTMNPNWQKKDKRN
jgi:hypothetical protein